MNASAIRERYESAWSRVGGGPEELRIVRQLAEAARAAGLIAWDRLLTAHCNLYDHPEAGRDECEAITSDPDAPEDIRGWANLLLQRFAVDRSQSTEAVKRSTAIIESARSSPTQRTLALLSRAEDLRAMGEYDAALSDLSSVVEASGATPPDRAVALSNRGVILGELGEYERALADLAAVMEDPASDGSAVCKAHYNRSTIYVRRGEYQRAADEATRAIELAALPPYLAIKARYNRALALRGLNAHAAAVADFTAALEQASAPGDWRSLALLFRGESHAKLGQLRPAIEDFTSLLKESDDPSLRWEAFVERAKVYLRWPDPAAATNDYLAALAEPVPSQFQVGVQGMLGDAYRELGQFDEAIAAYTAVLDAEPEPTSRNANARMERATTYLLSEKRALARSDFQALVGHPAATPAQRMSAEEGLAVLMRGEES